MMKRYETYFALFIYLSIRHDVVGVNNDCSVVDPGREWSRHGV